MAWVCVALDIREMSMYNESTDMPLIGPVTPFAVPVMIRITCRRRLLQQARHLC
jgi:hypothetical protein